MHATATPPAKAQQKHSRCSIVGTPHCTSAVSSLLASVGATYTVCEVKCVLYRSKAPPKHDPCRQVVGFPAPSQGICVYCTDDSTRTLQAYEIYTAPHCDTRGKCVYRGNPRPMAHAGRSLGFPAPSGGIHSTNGIMKNLQT